MSGCRRLRAGQTVIAAVLLTAPLSISPHAQTVVPSQEGNLADLLVWGPNTTGAIGVLEPDLRAAVEGYRRRWRAYQSPRRRPANPETSMVYDAEVGYERRLVAIGSGPNVAALARAYVAALRPC